MRLLSRYPESARVTGRETGGTRPVASIPFQLARFAILVIVLAINCFGQDKTDVSSEIREVAGGVRLTLVAEHPDVATPTGIDVDKAGNVWVVASNTHFRPDDYNGPEHDEVLVLAADGSRRVFYQKTKRTMDLELGRDGWVYLAERNRILRVRDSDGDGAGDQHEDIAVLKSDAIYPHNGLSGMAWHPDGDLVFALGENFSQPWILTGTDGSRTTGSGEGGVFRCRPDGTDLRRIAKGFWNPFGVCVRADGTMFAAENDPGARPPCRLLHVVEGGDYGYQRQYGAAPVHPFVCWDGQLPGTLPMLHSLGEAPCGIAPLGNGLIVPTWTDHRIDFYPLRAKGASFETKRIVLVEGGRNFRPVCIVQAAPTVFYLSDWVFGSYAIHGYGRVWKLEIDPTVADWIGPMEIPEATEEAQTAEKLRLGNNSIDDKTLLELARSSDPFLARAAIDGLSLRVNGISPQHTVTLPVPDRINLLLAVRKSNPKDEAWIDLFWNDPSEEVRFETLRWIADEQLERYRERVERELSEPAIEFSLYEACLATWNTLTGNPSTGVVDPEMLLQRVMDTDAPPRTRAFALRLLDPRHRKLTPKVWDELAATKDAAVIRELTRSQASNGSTAARERLLQTASNMTISTKVRADAIVGLAGATGEAKAEVLRFVASEERTLREEALRALRFSLIDDKQRRELEALSSKFPDSSDLFRAVLDHKSIPVGRPALDDTAGWATRLQSLVGTADIEAGRRIFFHSKIGMCANCHRHSGRGNVVGPDLTAASTDGDPNRLLRALLEPSRDVDPQYHPWSLVTEDGQVFVGILLRDGGGGSEVFRDDQGRERKFSTDTIVARKPLTTSMMPDGLIDLLTDREIRDLLAFLDNARENN